MDWTVFLKILGSMTVLLGALSAGLWRVFSHSFKTLQSGINLVRADMKEQFDGVRAEVNGIRTDMKEQIVGVRTEINDVRTDRGGPKNLECAADEQKKGGRQKN